MNFKIKLVFTLFTNFIILFLFYYLSNKTPFTGDEIGTLDISALHKPIPYKALLSFLFSDYEYTHGDINFFRSTSYLFVFLTIVLWNFIVIKNYYELIIFNSFIVTSSFVLSEAIYFRYYSYYLLCSTISMILLTIWLRKTKSYKVLLSIILMFLSPYVFFILNGLQYGLFSFILIFKRIRNIKTKVILLVLTSVSFLTILFKPIIVWNLLKFFQLSDHGGNFYSSFKLKGITISVLVKPFYALFQMFFGYNIIPTESLIYIILIIFIGICFLVILYKIFKKQNELFYLYLFCFIIPFISIYYFFESISLPGFTQLESKHGLLFYPFLILLIIKHNRLLKYKVNYIFLIMIFFCHLLGMKATLRKTNTAWPNIVSSISQYNDKEDINILMDGRSSSTFKFYNNDQIAEKNIKYTWEDDNSLESIFTNDKSLVLLLNDYKSYTPLTLDQNWNAASSSINRVEGLNKILYKINDKYRLIDSYIKYPTFFYLFEKKTNKNILSSVGVWKHHLKDVILPFEEKGRKIISSILIAPNDSLFIGFNDELVINLEGDTRLLKNGKNVGFFEINNQKFKFVYGENIWNIFSNYHDLEFNDENVFHSWVHMPLVSGSIKYPGSYFKHRACIFSIDLNGILSEFIMVKNTSENQFIRVWI